jgi:DNA repair photolyase
MAINEITAKSILRKHKRLDSWFVSCYGMNLYRGCLHNCTYCDGRAEKYYVEGEFGRDIAVKANAISLLERELDPQRKRTPFPKSYICLGGGVGDAYQPVEKKYRLARRTLELCLKYHLPVQILTKSTLILDDLELIKEINNKNRAIVSFSFSSVNDEVSQIFEPGVPSPEERLKALSVFRKADIACGMFLMPVIPFITDTEELMEESVSRARESGLNFIIFSGMTLKEGKQKDFFLNKLAGIYPHLVSKYKEIYQQDQWGSAVPRYYKTINDRFYKIALKNKMPVRIYQDLFEDLLTMNDKVAIMLDQIDYVLKLQGKRSPYGYASYIISQLKQPLTDLKGHLTSIKGVGPQVARIILEILEKNRSELYSRLVEYKET